MKFTFPIAEMVRTLNVLGKVIQKSCPMPILQNVLITKPDPKEEVYLMTAGSAESMMTIKVNITMVDGTAFKPICIPHGQFLQVLSAFADHAYHYGLFSALAHHAWFVIRALIKR